MILWGTNCSKTSLQRSPWGQRKVGRCRKVWLLWGSRSVACRVRRGSGKPGKTWNFIVAFFRTGTFWKRAAGHGKCWNSVKSQLNQWIGVVYTVCKTKANMNNLSSLKCGKNISDTLGYRLDCHLFSSYLILTLSVISYWTDARQHGIYLLITYGMWIFLLLDSSDPVTSRWMHLPCDGI